jgi:hypothetical protein
MVAAASLSALTTPALSVLLGSVVEQAQRLACPVGDGLILGSVVDRSCSSAHIHNASIRVVSWCSVRNAT